MRPLTLRTLLALSFFTLSASVVTFLSAATPPSTPSFAQEHSDLRADPAAKFGTLKNGLRYVILPNKEPKERVSLRLLVLAGSFHETENERGLAHYLEHLAFNGSTHFAPGTLVEFFQRMGMSFGGDTNANTSFNRTVYLLELPDTKPATLDEGFTVFSDHASGLLLNEEQVDKERGIILSEKRAADSIEFRQIEAYSKALFGDTLLPHRFPIGEVVVIEKATREQFVDFYNTWYRPERMAIVATGDFDAAEIERQITMRFATIAPRAAARPDPDLGKIPTFTGLRATHHYDAEAPDTRVIIDRIIPWAREIDNAANRTSELRASLALAMLNRRLSILVKKEGAPFRGSAAYTEKSFGLYRQANITLACNPDQWPAALAVAEQEMRRALTHGFDDAELREATANFINHLEQADKTAPTRRSPDLADNLVEALLNDTVFTTPAAELAFFKPELEKITAAECLAALREYYTTPGVNVLIMGNAKIDGDAKAAIAAAYEKSAATPVAAPEKIADATFDYTDFGPAGKVTAQKHIDDLDLDQITFANNVRLNLKKTDFETGKIQINIRIGAGKLIEPKDKSGISDLAGRTFLAGGLGKHSADDLQRIFAGKTVSTNFEVEPDALQFQGATNPADLLLQLQQITAYITDPGYRPESLREVKQNLEADYNQLARTLEGPINIDIPVLLASGDTRFGRPKKADAFALTLEEIRAWLAPQFATGAIEIGIVGDLDSTAAIAAVSRTLGALPTRTAKPAYTDERRVSFPAPFSKTFKIETEIPKGVIAFYWPTTDARDVKVTHRLNILAEICGDRLRVQVREKLGDTYSPFAGNRSSETYTDYGMLFAFVVIDPTKAQLLDETITAIAADLAANGVTDDELTRAKQPVLTSLRESARTNGYWLNAVLASAQEFPQRLDWSRTRYTDNESITKADIDALAKKYLAPERAFRATIIPATGSDPK